MKKPAILLKDFSKSFAIFLPVQILSLPFALFFFNDTATTEIYTLSLHDALPIRNPLARSASGYRATSRQKAAEWFRSEEHTSELQSPVHLVCRLLLEKKKTQ